MIWNGLVKGGLLKLWASENKMNDLEFIKHVSKFDIIWLGVIHSESENSFPGFISIKKKIRDERAKLSRIAEEFGVLVKK